MSSIMVTLLHRARICPVACTLKILLLLLLLGALVIAIYFKNEVSIYTYLGFMATIGYVAVLAIATNGNCRLKLAEEE